MSAGAAPLLDLHCHAALQMPAPADLTVFLAHVAAGYPVFGSPGAVERIAREAVEDAAAAGLAFLELRLGPTTHARPGFDVRAVLAAACAGAADGARATGVEVGVVPALLRHQDADAHAAVTDAACALAGHGVTGLDVAGDELLFPALEPYAPFFAQARAAGLGVTAHAAEAAPAPAARAAAELLGVRRIGHGSRAADDPEVLAWATGEGIVFEVCPTSNVLTGAAASVREHPLGRFLAAGCRVVLGDDDPTTTGVRLDAEVRGLLAEGLLDGPRLRQVAGDSVAVALCDEPVRDRLRRLLG
ncbi:adenosine deaminase family protein [Blastococcus sp. SYSU D00820]